MSQSAAAPSSFNVALRVFFLRLRVALVGVALDFWKDAPWPWGGKGDANASLKPRKIKDSARAEKKAKTEDAQNSSHEETFGPKPWAADRLGVIEAMWGSGHCLPGGDPYLVNLAAPLSINSEMSVLDLCAGFGDMARHLVTEYKTYVTGMEPDAGFAARGMVMSIAAGKSKTASVVPYDPVNFTASRKYDCIIARELFYRIIGKDKFFKAIDSSLKTGGGTLLFTDFILDPAAREKPSIVNWLKAEKNAAPLSSIEMIKTWKGMGYDLRVAEDQTDEYKAMILEGLKNIANHMILHRPDSGTKPYVVREVDLWVRRVEAFSHGLRYYRFLGIKH